MANKPNNPGLWSRAKSLAKKKFDVYPSAYANGWAAKYYKSKGGTWRSAKNGAYMEDGGKMPSSVAKARFVAANKGNIQEARQDASKYGYKFMSGGKLKAAYMAKGGNIRHTTKGPGANYRPTKQGAGMTAKGVAAYRRANPGSKLSTAVTGKVKPGSKAAMRRKSYCARSLGQLRRSSQATQNDPNSRIRQARRRWKC